MQDVHRYKICETEISPSDRKSVCDMFLRRCDGFKWIATLNPEIILSAHNDASYQKVVNLADLHVIDGFGLKLALRTRGIGVQRYTGVDLLGDLLYSANIRKVQLAYVIPKNALSKKGEINSLMQEQYPDVIYEVYIGAGVATKKALKVLKPQFIVVSMGAPEQEQFLMECAEEALYDCIGVGVGGAVDFITGVMPRAPQWMQTCGLEWLHRLYCEPRRTKRIINATIVFPYVVARNLLKD